MEIKDWLTDLQRPDQTQILTSLKFVQQILLTPALHRLQWSQCKFSHSFGSRLQGPTPRRLLLWLSGTCSTRLFGCQGYFYGSVECQRLPIGMSAWSQTKELLFSVCQFHQCGKEKKVAALFQQQPGVWIFITATHRQKKPCLMAALPPGKFLRARKVFARHYEIHH